LTQEVAYGSLLLKRRKEIHEKIGNVIEDLYSERLEEYYEILAYHYERSDNKDKALRYLDLANRKASNASAMEDAKGYFYKAMEILDTMPDTTENQEQRISLIVNQWIVFEQLFKRPEYYDLLTRYESLVAEIKNIGMAGGFYGRMGRCEVAFGYFDKGIKSATKAVELSEATGNAEYAGSAFFVLQFSHLYKGDFDRVFALKEDILRMTTEQFNLFTYVRSFVAISLAFSFCGRWDEAVKEGKNALNTAQEYSDDSLISYAAYAISIAYTHKGEMDRAFEYGEMAIKKAPTPLYKATAQSVLAWAWCRAGEPYKGIETLDAYVQIFRAGHVIIGEIALSASLSEGYLMTGEYDKAEQTAKEALEVAERCGAKFFVGWALRLLGEIALETNHSKALPHFEKSITIFKETKAENELAKAYEGYGRLYKKQGDTAQAREYLMKALEIFERLGTLIEPGKVKKELADLPPDEG
ncbi:MAG: tetratricopeptide repeat protein, partial [Desulfobacteraceae bacterium]|nr:tetratricopeptide repeat protein [Desulfobacteraceae bacterium]MBC2756944.1 tetratricopeptide repeat protein [Desulfobacteraceae bacterium]